MVLGRWLGAALLTCFLTGLVSHVLQQPPHGLAHLLPTRPVDGYRVTQGLHVASGIAAIPLAGAKLWTVYPRLFEWPPVRGVLHALERLGIAVLVAATLLELFTGLLNTLQWYPWPFPFRQTHFWLGWLATGGLLVHVAVKAPVIGEHWRRARAVVPGRRAFLVAVGTAVGAVTVTTAGQSVPWLRPLDLLAPRRPGAACAACRSTGRPRRPARSPFPPTGASRSTAHGRCASPSPTSANCPSTKRSCRSPVWRAGA